VHTFLVPTKMRYIANPNDAIEGNLLIVNFDQRRVHHVFSG
jgi:hypothetical protein